VTLILNVFLYSTVVVTAARYGLLNGVDCCRYVWQRLACAASYVPASECQTQFFGFRATRTVFGQSDTRYFSLSHVVVDLHSPHRIATPSLRAFCTVHIRRKAPECF